jgi:stress response protein SCP2
MTALAKGGNAPLSARSCIVGIRWTPAALADVDVSAFLLASGGKVRGDDDMVFYGHPSPGRGRVRQTALARPIGTARETVFAVDLAGIEPEIDTVAFAAVVPVEAPGRRLADLAALEALVEGEGVSLSFAPDLAGATEAAMTLVTLYRRDGGWKVRAVGQGFDGGLKPLAESYGVAVEDEPAAPSAPSPQAARVVDLRKRLVDLAKRDPALAASAETALVSLEKRGIAGLRGKVALVLDISGSMRDMFKDGRVGDLVRRVLATALPIDDDGHIDVFLFGVGAHAYGPVTEHTYRRFPEECQRRYGFEPGTKYGEAIELVRATYRPHFGDGLPVYVVFITDGGTQDVRKSKDAITAAAAEPIFWQFVAIGEHEGKAPARIGRTLPRGFDFLAMLDTMDGRVVDNAGFFAVPDPSAPTDAELYDMMFEEFPDWLRAARRAGVLR